jgi:hypothetical protein
MEFYDLVERVVGRSPIGDGHWIVLRGTSTRVINTLHLFFGVVFTQSIFYSLSVVAIISILAQVCH